MCDPYVLDVVKQQVAIDERICSSCGLKIAVAGCYVLVSDEYRWLGGIEFRAAETHSGPRVPINQRICVGVAFGAYVTA